MIGLVLALMVGMLFGTGTYLLLRRDPIKLILGLSLLTYGINVLIFGTGMLRRGLPPVIPDKETFSGDISGFVDPLPQALILTAIVISFGVTAFIVVLLNRRNALIQEHEGDRVNVEIVNDPFAEAAHFLSGLDEDPDDYEWLEYSLADEYRQRQLEGKDIDDLHGDDHHGDDHDGDDHDGDDHDGDGRDYSRYASLEEDPR